jgi:transcriptional regulator GlxA family with amidase domain
MARHIGFIVYPAFDLLDLAGPLEVFDWAERSAPGSYICHVLTPDGGRVRSSGGLSIESEAASPGGMDTMIVIGGGSAMGEPDPKLLEFIRQGQGVRRRGSVCTGAFLLAGAGLLDGRMATTHWRWTSELKARFPAIRVNGDRIFTADRGTWTSAGITTGIDMTLAMVEEDIGLEVAREVARTMVIYYRRPGGQPQFSSLVEHEPETDRMRRVLAYARENLSDRLSVEKLAAFAHLSPRQFSRAFRSSTGTTPAKTIEKLRVETARPRVEDTSDFLDIIARDVGFTDAMRMRDAFIRVFGFSPQEMRRNARLGGPDDAG